MKFGLVFPSCIQNGVSVGEIETIAHAHTTSGKASVHVVYLKSARHLFQNVGRQRIVNVCWMIPKMDAAGQSV